MIPMRETILTKKKAMMTEMKADSCQKKLALILTAAGSSNRMGGLKKEYLELNGGTVLSSAASVFLDTLGFSAVIVTFPHKEDVNLLKIEEEKSHKAVFSDERVKKAAENGTKFFFVPGGNNRQASVYNALLKLHSVFGENPALVFIHDGARPFVSKKIIVSTYALALENGCAAAGIEPVDTQKEIDEKGFITKHLVRSKMISIQTPQVFPLNELFQAHKKAQNSAKEFTDDTEIWDEFSNGQKIKVSTGESSNKKITFKQDLDKKSGEKGMIRIGLGYDKHALVKNRKLMLGGIQIESELGEDGHSDGDVLLHAITDALLGASALGDIGSFFPPEEAKWKDADSKSLLKTVWKKIKEEGWSLVNLDCVIALEKPKFLPHRQAVIASIAETLEVNSNQIFVKAKTGEKLGDVGQSRAIEAFATCLLEQA
ncbi:2-C-methyl-D-erythritol 2,4-cyclodiphosphate synthase [Treponema pectinovorum]|uniref:2-C-methyl-D-erythritol 2,4-cyclodiphosphate synthase n=1 Tax=Treponema pectinovorum TaxID=164 RepID=UPI0021C3F73C|nr:2-C-methyl-D-erythritol 2,4-cyclodiphosphate synthase [Treponema pectinovorum]